MRRGGFAGRGRRYADRTKLTWHTRSAATRSMTVCPPSVLAPDIQRALSDPGKPFSWLLVQSATGATVGPRSFFVSSA